jgi:multiple sugar transport system substrate-binding protein
VGAYHFCYGFLKEGVMRKAILILSTIILLLSLPACTGQPKDPKEFHGTLKIWACTDEIKKMIDRFESIYTGVKVELLIVPCGDLHMGRRPRIPDPEDERAPDLLTAEYSEVIDLVESGFYTDLGQFNPHTEDLVDYVVDVGTDSSGKLRLLSWSMTPGGLYYRRSIAKKYLGTDDPEQIGEMLSTTDTFLDTARRLKEASGGNVKLIAGYGDYQQYQFSQRKQSFVVDGRLNLEQPVLDYFDIAKIMRDEELTAEIGTWSPPWFENMNKAEPEIFGYILPTWGLHYVIKSNAKDTIGDWGLCRGPGSYFWGGTWMGINRCSKNRELAWEFVKMCVFDENTLVWWSRQIGEYIDNVICNENVIENIKNDFSDELLAGQNHYLFFADEASKINGKLLGRYDLDIREFFMGAVNNYVEGTMTKQEAIKQFKDDVKKAFPKVQVE